MTTEKRWRRTGVAIGVAAVVAVGWQGRIDSGAAVLGVDLRLSAAPSGELAVSPAGTFLDAEALQPGGTAHGKVTVRNQTGSTLSLAGRTTPAIPGELRMRIRADDTELSESQAFTLGSGQDVVVAVDVSLDADGTTLLGRALDIAVQFDVDKAGS